MALITIDQQTEKLAALLAGVAGLNSLDKHPDALQKAHFPCTIPAPGPAQYARDGDGDRYRLTVTRQWRIKLYLMPREAGREYQAELQLRPFLTSIPDALAPHTMVRLADGRTFELTLDRGSDSSLSIMKYGDREYSGSLFTVTTIVKDRVMPAR